MHAIEILDDLTIVSDRHVIGQLEPSQAFDMAEQLVRFGMRRILVEEGADALDERGERSRADEDDNGH